MVATTDGFLLQLDAKTGELFKGVGKDGLVDLKVGMTEKYGGGYEPVARAIYKNFMIFAAFHWRARTLWHRRRSARLRSDHRQGSMAFSLGSSAGRSEL